MDMLKMKFKSKREAIAACLSCSPTRSSVAGSHVKTSSRKSSSLAAKAPTTVPTGSIGPFLPPPHIHSTEEADTLKNTGDNHHRNNEFELAIRSYDEAIRLWPNNAIIHYNRSSALMGLLRLPEAARACEESVALDPRYSEAHMRLFNLFISLGQLENARRFHEEGEKCEKCESQSIDKLTMLEDLLKDCEKARESNNWENVIQAVDKALEDKALEVGANYSPQLYACKGEALLKLNRIEEAVEALSHMSVFFTTIFHISRIFGMHIGAYVYLVKASISLAVGNFDKAYDDALMVEHFVFCVRKVQHFEANIDIKQMVEDMKGAIMAYRRGTTYFEDMNYEDALSKFNNAHKLSPKNEIILSMILKCLCKLRDWEGCVQFCNNSLDVFPGNKTVLQQRATFYFKLKKWKECVEDFKALRVDLPLDKAIAKSYYDAKMEKKKSKGKDVSKIIFGGNVQKIKEVRMLLGAIDVPMTTVVYCCNPSEPQNFDYEQLCAQHPLLKFCMIDIDKRPEVACQNFVKLVCGGTGIVIFRKGKRYKVINDLSQLEVEEAMLNLSRIEQNSGKW